MYFGILPYQYEKEKLLRAGKGEGIRKGFSR
jgi:hypothetical protein